MKPFARQIASAIVFTIIASVVCCAQSESVLYAFGGVFGGFKGGSQPMAGLVRNSSGNLYGTTEQGGGNHDFCTSKYGQACGLVFELSPTATGWTETILHTFVGTDGVGPNGSLILDKAGNLYGTVTDGGNLDCLLNRSVGCGTVFQLSPVSGGGWTFRLLYEFSGTDGAFPFGNLIFDDNGNLYGTTDEGGYGGSGCTYACGVVFELSPTPSGFWNEKVLYEFKNGNDGWGPSKGLVFDKAGNLFGTARIGGAYGFGTVFKLSPSVSGNWNETTLHAFTSGSDGAGHPA